MSPFQVLYGHRCITPINWSGIEDKLILGHDMLKEMEEAVTRVRINLRAAQGKQKMYFDKRKSYLEFQVRDHVYVKVKPKKSTLQ